MLFARWFVMRNPRRVFLKMWSNAVSHVFGKHVCFVWLCRKRLSFPIRSWECQGEHFWWSYDPIFLLGKICAIGRRNLSSWVIFKYMSKNFKTFLNFLKGDFWRIPLNSCKENHIMHQQGQWLFEGFWIHSKSTITVPWIIGYVYTNREVNLWATTSRSSGMETGLIHPVRTVLWKAWLFVGCKDAIMWIFGICNHPRVEKCMELQYPKKKNYAQICKKMG